MAHFSSLLCPVAARPWLLALLLLLAAPLVRAQAPAWGGAAVGSSSASTSTSTIHAVATDASGNVFVTGFFTGAVSFGSTLLTSAGGSDIFVAKWLPATATWAWAQSGGGTDQDYGEGIAVSGTSVYVTGSFTNTATNTNAVLFGGTGPATGTTQVNGTAPTRSTTGLLLLKYTDNGSSATLRWTQVGGSNYAAFGRGVAVSGTSVYVTGAIFNNTNNTETGVFGGGGTTPGTVQVNGASSSSSADLVLAKYQDNGSSATLAWTRVGGGTDYDTGTSVAVSGTSIYVVGYLSNTTSNVSRVLFGGGGTTPGTVPVSGASPITSTDVLLAKYTDNGPSATLAWTQVGGGTDFDIAYGVAVSGPSVYVTGYITNSQANANLVVFGGSGTTAGTVPVNGAGTASGANLLLAKYTDSGLSATLTWTQVNGSYSQGSAVAVAGTSLYVTSSALVRYQDNGGTGSLTWAQMGHGGFAGVAISGQQVYAGGATSTPATYGPTTIPASAAPALAVLAYLTDATLLPARPAATAGPTGLTLYPNPAPHGAATLTGTAPGAPVQVLDALGRVVATTRADATGTARLAGLPAGLYVVRAGAGAARLSVE